MGMKLTTTVMALSLSSGLMAQGFQSTQLWILNGDTGDYVLSRPDGDGRDRVVYTPGVYVLPTFSVSLATLDDDTTLYSYTIFNGEGARQPVRNCDIPLLPTTDVERTPAEWDSTVTRARGFMSWFKLNRGGTLGVLPSMSQAGFALRSRGLPGVGIANCRGTMSVPGLFPWVSQTARAELDILMAKDFVSVSLIAPVIEPAAVEEPLSVLSRVRTNYESAMELAGGDALQELEGVESDLRRGATVVARGRLEKLLMVLDTDVVEGWDGQVRDGLAFCLRVVLGKLVDPVSR
jgi:hypothetical protein